MLFSEDLGTRVSIIPAKASINGKRSVEFVSRYEVRLYFLPGPVGGMKYWHISSRLNSHREMAEQIPRDTEENKQNEIQYKVCITWDRWNQPFLIYSFPSNSSLTIFIGKQDQKYKSFNWLLLNEHIFDLLIVLHRVEISYSRTDTSPDADERPMFGHMSRAMKQ